MIPLEVFLRKQNLWTIQTENFFSEISEGNTERNEKDDGVVVFDRMAGYFYTFKVALAGIWKRHWLILFSKREIKEKMMNIVYVNLLLMFQKEL